MRFRLFSIALFALAAVSCSTPKQVAYFQDLRECELATKVTPVDIRFQPHDQLSILVSCKDMELATVYNLPIASTRIAQGAMSAQGGTNIINGMGQNGTSGYTIDADGCIDFPVLGRLHIAGMTRSEVSAFIKDKLVSSNELKNPIVTVEYMNQTFAVFGEVTRPGRYNIDRDHVSILDAISMAGDLTIYGQRANVRVVRQDPITMELKSYTIDMTNSNSVFTSPVFYLQQNDQIYVEPNTMRAGQSTVNSNNVVSTSFWLSVASLIATVTSLIIAASK